MARFKDLISREELRECLLRGEAISCGNDEDVKQFVLSYLEDIGFTIGFRREESRYYQYVYYAEDLCEIHMSKNAGRFSVIIPAERILYYKDESFSMSPEDLYDWEDFFCCGKAG